MNKEILKIGLLDDHCITRQAMVCFINQFQNCRIAFAAGDTYDLKETLAKKSSPDLLLLEVNGFETLAWLKDNHPNIPVIILTRFEIAITSDRLIYFGAKAVLEKDVDDTELKKAFLKVKEDGFYYNTPALRKMAASLSKGKPKLFFTEREWQYLPFVPTKMTHTLIADKMKISTAIVGKINSKLFEKLHVGNRAELAMLVVSHGLFHTKAT